MAEITKAHLAAKRIERERNMGPATKAAADKRRHEAAIKAWDKRGRKKDRAAQAAAQAAAAQAGGPAPANQSPVQMGLGSARGDWRVANPHARVESEMKTSPVHKAKPNMGKGISEAYKIYLESGQKCNFKPDRGEVSGVRDGIKAGMAAEREVAAWEVAKLVGMDDMVSPVVIREVDVPGGYNARRSFDAARVRGSAALWAEGDVGVEAEWKYGRDAKYGNSEEDQRRAAMYDYIIGNQDRHAKNWVIDKDKKLKLIDHGLSFGETRLDSFTNRKILEKVSIGKAGNVGPGKYAEPYVKKKDAIKTALMKVGIPAKAIARVMDRIDRASLANDWMTVSNDRE